MSYEKMMRRENGHRHDHDIQPILFSMDGKNIESEANIANRTMKSCHVEVRNSINDRFIRVSGDFDTEDEAIQFCEDNDLYSQFAWIRIYTDKGLRLSGW